MSCAPLSYVSCLSFVKPSYALGTTAPAPNIHMCPMSQYNCLSCDVALQTPAVNVPNELTVAHFWRDEKRPREYDFDAVFGPQHSQVRPAPYACLHACVCANCVCSCLLLRLYDACLLCWQSVTLCNTWLRADVVQHQVTVDGYWCSDVYVCGVCCTFPQSAVMANRCWPRV